MSAAIVATTRPNQIILLKGNMPLEVRFNLKYKVIAYASESDILDYALKGGPWEHIPISTGEELVIDSHNISAIKRFQFEFDGIDEDVYSVTGTA